MLKCGVELVCYVNHNHSGESFSDIWWFLVFSNVFRCCSHPLLESATPKVKHQKIVAFSGKRKKGGNDNKKF